MEFKVDKNQEKGIITISATNRLDGIEAIEFRKKILSLVEEKNYKIVIDLTNTNFIDSNGISSLVARIHVCRSNGGDVKLAGVAPPVEDILQLTNLDKIFEIFKTPKIALDKWSEKEI